MRATPSRTATTVDMLRHGPGLLSKIMSTDASDRLLPTKQVSGSVTAFGQCFSASR